MGSEQAGKQSGVRLQKMLDGQDGGNADLARSVSQSSAYKPLQSHPCLPTMANGPSGDCAEEGTAAGRPSDTQIIRPVSIRLVLLDELRCLQDGAETDLPKQKLRFALLAYLGVERSVPREKLTAVLWPEVDEERSRRRLSQAIFELRKMFGPDLIETRGSEMRAGESLLCDARDFGFLADAGEYERALQLYRRPFLDGFYVDDAAEFERWAERRRAVLARTYAQVARAQTQRLIAAGAYQQAVQQATGWLELDENNDDAHCALLDALVGGDRLQDALTHYEDVERQLWEEQSRQPSGSLKQRGQDIRTGLKRAPDAARVTNASAAASANGVANQSVTPVEPLPAESPSRPQPEQQGDQDGAEESRGRRLKPSELSRGQIAVVGALVGIAIVFAIGMPRREPITSRCRSNAELACPGLDSTAYVVPPFGNGPDGLLFADWLSQSLTDLQDISVPDHLRVIDMVRRVAAQDRQLSVDSAVLIARQLGAGRLIIGALTSARDSVHVVASLYATDRFGPARKVARLHFSAAEFLSIGARVVVDSLLATGRTGGGRQWSSSLTALREFAQGNQARASWDLDAAVQHYRAAAERDSTFALAFFRLAQTMAWRTDTVDTWRQAARRAQQLADNLTAMDGKIATAMAHLANRDYPAACEEYRAVTRMDSLNFSGWQGLGDCLAWDIAVIVDPKTLKPSFRSSYHEAIGAYQRALLLVPSFNGAYQGMGAARLANVLHVTPRVVRAGFRFETGDLYVARPELIDDTLAYPPQILQTRLGAAGSPAATHAAIERNRTLLLETAKEWARALPQSVAAHEALASALELIQAIRPTNNAETSALDAITTARELATEDTDQLRLAARELSLRIKNAEFARASRLADSMIERFSAARPVDGYFLSLAYAATGRALEAADALAATTTVSPLMPANWLAEHSRLKRLSIYAAFGIKPDSLRDGMSQLDAKLELLPFEKRPRATSDLLRRVADLAFPTVGASAIHHKPEKARWVARQAALAAGNRSVCREIMADTSVNESIEAPIRFGAMHLRLLCADTAGAAQVADDVLQHLTALDSRLYMDPLHVISLVRLMALRSALASRLRDDETARQWARSVVTLWSNADPELQRLVRTAREVAAPRRFFFR
jgi:DNA-binding SARP family transcriptional activator